MEEYKINTIIDFNDISSCTHGVCYINKSEVLRKNIYKMYTYVKMKIRQNALKVKYLY